MKTKIYFISLIFVLTGSIFSQSVVPDLMYFRFENNFGQTSTLNFAQTPVGTNPAPLVEGDSFGAGGQFDSCLVGTGTTTGCLNTGWATVLPANWTISFWLGPNQVDMNPSYLFGDVNAGAFRCFYGGTAFANNLLLRGGSADILVTGVNPAATVVTFVYNGSNTTVYKNGILFSTFPVFFTNSGAGPFKIGGYGTGLTTLSGKMDEFRFYNRALSASEISATWNIEFVNIFPLCEQFSNTTFPPTGWSITWSGSGTQYWRRVLDSGFGIGIGSAQYNFWDSPSYATGQLFTSQLYPSLPGDSLTLDIAYQPFASRQDSLIILTSTNNGTNYVSLVRLGPEQLATTSGNPTPFEPKPSQWIKRTYGPLPAGTNKIEFNCKSGFGDDLYIDSICMGQTLVGISNNSNHAPITYTLSQNYPNPFNPTTVISYGLPKAGNVKLVVFDILGREVKTLIDEFKQAGSYNVTFDGTNLASGIYFYTISAQPSDRLERSDGYAATKKMLMLK